MKSISPLVKRVHHNILENHLLKDGDKVIVAVSGGSDSVALLNILSQCGLNLQLVSVDVDHGLRPEESKREILLISHLCRVLKIPFISKSVDVHGFAKKEKKSIEESGRILRYKVLENVRNSESAVAIAVGHTTDDQVEEFFIRLIRGSGMKGLGGMLPQNGNIVRPLLNETKSALTSYLDQQHVEYCFDSSNESRKFLRNKVRLDLLPLLRKEFNPSIAETTLRTMSILRQEDEFLDVISAVALAKICCHPPQTISSGIEEMITLNSSLFVTEHPAIQRRVLEKVCWKLGNRPTFQTINDLQEFIKSSLSGSRIHLAEGLRVMKSHDHIQFDYPKGKKSYRGDQDERPTHFSYKIREQGTFAIAELGLKVRLTVEEASQEIKIRDEECLLIDEQKISYPLELRPVKAGEKIKLLGAPGSKKINRILSDQKIPNHKRRYHPVLADQFGPIVIIGLRVADRVQITSKTKRILKIKSWNN